MLIKKQKIVFTAGALLLLYVLVVIVHASLNTDRTVGSRSKTALQSLNNLRAYPELYRSETATSGGVYAAVPLPPQMCERTQGTMFEDDAVFSYVSRATSLGDVTAVCAADATRYAILVGPVKLTGESACIDNTLPQSILVNGSLTGFECPPPAPAPRKFPFTIFPFNLIPAWK